MKRKKKTPVKQALEAIERGAKRKAQKAAGALDGRFRVKVVPNKKRRPPPIDPDGTA